MRILIIRHGDPYYPTDSLTEKGRREVELLGKRIALENPDAIYVSPLGRAQLTAEPTLKLTGKKAETKEWLKEFPLGLKTKYKTKFSDDNLCPWNMPPEMWSDLPGAFDNNGWRKLEMYRNTGIIEEHDRICSCFDELIAEHGFIKDGYKYKIKKGFENSEETVAFFCHMGLGLLLVSHIMNLPLTAIWHTLFLPTSSVTTIFMEKHLDDNRYANARIIQVGDTSHLYAGNEPVSPNGLHSEFIR